MPVDTLNKRFAMLGLGQPALRIAPHPDGAVDLANRYQWIFLYPPLTPTAAPRIVDVWGSDDHIIGVAGTPTFIVEIWGRDDHLLAVRGQNDQLVTVAGAPAQLIEVEGNEDMPVKTDIGLFQGADHIIRITMTANGSIAGQAFAASIRDQHNRAPVLLEPACTINSAGDASSPGIVDCTLTDTQTETLEPGSYGWDAWREDEGSEYPIAYGVASVRALPSRA